MHELSIAMSIVDMATEEAERRNAIIEAVHLELGPLSGVVADALEFSWQIACSGTPIEGARLIIQQVPLQVFCPACNAPKTLASMQWFYCPDCGGPTAEVLHGKELNIVALEIRDECPTAPAGSP
ncbi:MAG TPA: hydrogenase maturation nickel metallochaperone HypA [Acidobacteriaceae bacterium]|jgi:hydrogenase nickel incorporation protein HypA/HybF|nr:hydrogenase maturation nickel metallochaperone HypA [Acidobacteriaceae bacterium]